MNKKSVRLDQYLTHDTFDYEAIKLYLKKTAPIIGFIVHRFNALEECLNLTICEWINSRTDSMGIIFVDKLNYSSKVDVLKKISFEFQIATHKDMVQTKKFLKNLSDIGSLRNAVIHAEWENTDFEGYTYLKIKVNEAGIHQEYQQFSLESLKGILKLINLTIEEFEDYWDWMRSD
jgi:hypothetical protein